MINLQKLITTGLVFLILISCTNNKSGNIYYKETVVAGSPEQFMEARHVVLKGSNYDIDKKIAEIAQKNNIQINPTGDQFKNKAQREYMKKNYPIYYECMKGVADAYSIDIENSMYDFSRIFQNSISGLGCSVVFYPGDFTKNGHGILSRNYDFTTGTIEGKHSQNKEMIVMSRPFIFEIYPENGYSSLSICAFDLLGGVLEGINSEGLTVAMLGDDETLMKFGREPADGVGVHELLSMRYLLDNCKDVKEAKEAMFYLKHFYCFIPCHYMIADRHGNSFVFEFSSLRNKTFIIDGNGPQCITNHLLSNYNSISELPKGEMIDSYDRFRTLHTALLNKDKFTTDEIKAINSEVAPADAPDNPVYAPGRTLWHALYDTEKRSINVKFYMGEKPNPNDDKKVIINYSNYIKFQLNQNKKQGNSRYDSNY